LPTPGLIIIVINITINISQVCSKNLSRLNLNKGE